MTLETVQKNTRLAVSFAGRVGFLLVCVFAGAIAGVVTNEWQRYEQWPYTVLRREIRTPSVRRGETLEISRLVEYHDEDCDLRYERRIQSQDPTGRHFEPADTYDEHLPIYMSGKWQTWTTKIPQDFPCGPAYLVETVSTACNLWQRNVRRLQRPNIITPFNVDCNDAR